MVRPSVAQISDNRPAVYHHGDIPSPAAGDRQRCPECGSEDFETDPMKLDEGWRNVHYCNSCRRCVWWFGEWLE